MNKDTTDQESRTDSTPLRLFVRFSSHRARDYGLRALDRRPQGFYSLTRSSFPGGFYQVTKGEIERMRAYSRHARFTILRAPHDDLKPCWTL